jgi:hypothetical protein
LSREGHVDTEVAVKRIDVVKKNNRWVAEQRAGQAVTQAQTKAEAIKRTAQIAKNDPEAVSVKIHKENGRIQEERTYPRRADPRRSPG